MQNILDFAIDIALEAGALIRENATQVQQVRFKGTVNPVTETDTAVEALLISRLTAAFPDHLILGEEFGGHGQQADRPIWMIDPLDGTNNFAHGFPHFCVSIGLVVAGAPAIGVVYDPMRNEVFSARKGAGAYLNGLPIRVSLAPTLRDAFLSTGFSYDRRVAADNNTLMLDHFLRRSQGVRRTGSAALDLAYVACGRLDGYWEAHLNPWDVAAGTLLVTESGGRVSDYAGSLARVYSGEEMVASNGTIHPEMLSVLRDGPAAPHPDFPRLS